MNSNLSQTEEKRHLSSKPLKTLEERESPRTCLGRRRVGPQLRASLRSDGQINGEMNVLCGPVETCARDSQSTHEHDMI